MRRRVGILSLVNPARKHLPEVLMGDVQGRPLCEWAIRSAREAARQAGVSHCMVALPEDEAIAGVALRLGVEIIPIPGLPNPTGVGDPEHGAAYGAVSARGLDWILEINPCFPFLTVKAHLAWIERAGKVSRPACAVLEQQCIVWDENGNQVIRWDPHDAAEPPLHYVPGGCYRVYPASLFGAPDPLPNAELVPLPDGLEYRTCVYTEEDLELTRCIARGFFRLPGESTLANLTYPW